jgi:hypothetical protein
LVSKWSIWHHISENSWKFTVLWHVIKIWIVIIPSRQIFIYNVKSWTLYLSAVYYYYYYIPICISRILTELWQKLWKLISRNYLGWKGFLWKGWRKWTTLNFDILVSIRNSYTYTTQICTAPQFAYQKELEGNQFKFNSRDQAELAMRDFIQPCTSCTWNWIYPVYEPIRSRDDWIQTIQVDSSILRINIQCFVEVKKRKQ